MAKKKMLLLALMTCVFASVCVAAQQSHQDKSAPDQTVYDQDVVVVGYDELSYPQLAKIVHAQGVVVVSAQLDDHGSVVNASTLAGPKPLLDECLANVRKWKFRPKTRNVVVVYEFRFADGSCPGKSRSFFQLFRPNFALITSCGPDVVEPASSVTQEPPRP
jgi:TonB family protein